MEVGGSTGDEALYWRNTCFPEEREREGEGETERLTQARRTDSEPRWGQYHRSRVLETKERDTEGEAGPGGHE